MTARTSDLSVTSATFDLSSAELLCGGGFFELESLTRTSGTWSTVNNHDIHRLCLFVTANRTQRCVCGTVRGKRLVNTCLWIAFPIRKFLKLASTLKRTVMPAVRRMFAKIIRKFYSCLRRHMLYCCLYCFASGFGLFVNVTTEQSLIVSENNITFLSYFQQNAKLSKTFRTTKNVWLAWFTTVRFLVLSICITRRKPVDW